MAWVVSSALALVGATGCGVQELPPEDDASTLQTQSQELEVDNGLSLNGLSLNGLSLNGLSLNGLSTTDFSSWFTGDPKTNDRLMRYMIRCAVPAGQTRSFTHPSTGVVYTWPGALGLAPNWAGGAPATLAEQQVISSCLAAHANNYGLHVAISVLGRDSSGANIPYSSEELAAYGKKESCFFGNVFANQGLYAGNDRNSLAADESTSRPCGLKGYKATANAECAQVQRIGQCEEYCTLDASGTFYTTCTYNGVQYRPLTTRIRHQDVHRCGDGICQQGESPGWGVTADSCLLDCGSPSP
ncbi:hypothetical protein [Archangium sp.]|uniref:hypothetical protein n=1 Tax=Archangium sp. TaxID=1872627 RepID=UPI002ED9BD73